MFQGQFAFYVVILGYFDPLKLQLKVMPHPWLSGSKRYELDLSNDVLNIHFGQRAAKISKVKVEVKKIFKVSRAPCAAISNLAELMILFDIQL